MTTYTPRTPHHQGTSPRFGQMKKILPESLAN
jgi:hypothetical protein